MMRLFGYSLLCAILAWIAMGCTTPATEGETRQMCEKLVELRGEVELVTVTEAITVLDKETEATRSRLAAEKKSALENLKSTLDNALSETTDAKQKEQLQATYETDHQRVEEDFKARIEALVPNRKSEAQKIEQKAAKSKSDWDEAVGKCLSDPLTSSPSKEVANCRIKATSVDQFWNACR